MAELVVRFVEWEVLPCPACGGSGFEYNLNGQAACSECLNGYVQVPMQEPRVQLVSAGLAPW